MRRGRRNAGAFRGEGDENESDIDKKRKKGRKNVGMRSKRSERGERRRGRCQGGDRRRWGRKGDKNRG